VLERCCFSSHRNFFSGFRSFFFRPTEKFSTCWFSEMSTNQKWPFSIIFQNKRAKTSGRLQREAGTTCVFFPVFFLFTTESRRFQPVDTEGPLLIGKPPFKIKEKERKPVCKRVFCHDQSYYAAYQIQRIQGHISSQIWGFLSVFVFYMFM